MIAAKVILFFWAFYFSIIFITNTIDVLKHFGVIPKWWKFTSGNYNFLLRVSSVYNLTNKILVLMFLCVILIEGAAAVYFWKIIFDLSQQIPNSVYVSFSLGLVLFGGFIFLDEIFMSFQAEVNHFRIFIALIVSLIFIQSFIG